MSKKQDLPGPQAFVENLLAYTVGIDSATKATVDSNVEQPPQATWGSWLSKAATNAYGAVTAPVETYNNIANASSMAAALYSNPQYIQDLMNDGLLSELAKHKDKANDLFGWLTYTPVVSTMLQNLGVDKEAFKIILELSSQSPKIADELGKKLASYMGSGTPTPEKTTEFMTAITNQAISLITSDKTANKTASVELIQSYLLKAKNHREALEANPGFKEINRLSLAIADPYKNLDDVNKLIDEKTELVAKHFSTMDNIAFALKDYTAIIDCLNDKKFLEAAVKNPEKLQDLTQKIIEMAFLYKDQKEINDNFKAVVLSAVDLVADKNVSEALQPLATEKLITAIFDLPSSEAIAGYRELVTDLTTKPENFQALLAALLKEKISLNKSLGATIEYINNPVIPKYKALANGSILGHREVGLSLNDNNELLAHTNQDKDGKPIIIIDLVLREKIKEQLRSAKEKGDLELNIHSALTSKELDLTPTEQLELYATTHQTERDQLDSTFNQLVVEWIDTSTQSDTLPTVLALADEKLTENILKLDVMVDSKEAEEVLVDGVIAVVETPEMQENISAIQKATLDTVLTAVKKTTINTPIQQDSQTKEAKEARRKNETMKFTALLSKLASVIGNLDSTKTQQAIKNAEKPLILTLDKAITGLPSLKKALDKFEINGEALIKIMPELCSERNLKNLKNIVKAPTATNIAILVVSDPKIFNFAMNHVMKYCKNVLVGKQEALGKGAEAKTIASPTPTPKKRPTQQIKR